MKKRFFSVAIFLCLIIFLSLGVCASVLSDHYGMRLDLTESKLYTLSDESTAVLSALSKPITITVYDLSADFPPVIKNLLDRYASASPALHVVYRDPYTAPQEIRALQEAGYDVVEGSIVIQSADETRLLLPEDLYELDDSGNSVKRLTTEQQITSAIDAVIRGERRTVLFMDGHGESPSSSLIELFENNHYHVSYAELSVIGIEKNTALIVICAPKKDASAEDIRLLEDYMEQGGAVLCFMEPGSSSLLRFSEFFEERGIRLTDEAVLEPDLYIADNRLNIVATYTGHEIDLPFANDRRYVVVPSSSAVEQLYIKQGRSKTQQVLRSSVDSYTASGEAGTRGLCVSSERTAINSSGVEVTQRLVVFGSKLVFGDDLLGEEKLGNSDFIIQTVSYLIGDEPLLNIPAKNLDANILPITAQFSRTYAAIVMVGIPVLILAFGLGICLRRKYL